MDNSPSPLLYLNRYLITPLVISSHNSLISLSQKSRTLDFLRQILVYVFFVGLNVINSFLLLLPCVFDNNGSKKAHFDACYHPRGDSNNNKQLVVSHAGNGRVSSVAGDTAISRAINQLLMLVNDVPVTSRKYEVIRCMVEKLIDDNLKEGLEVLREVNCVVLSDAFSRALIGLENELLGQKNDDGLGNGFSLGGIGLGRVMSMVKGWGGPKESGGPGGVNMIFAEKTAAELLWLAQKLEASGGCEIAVEKWAWATNLGWLALVDEPRVQSSLVKLTAFLIKQAKTMSKWQQQTDDEQWERRKQTLIKLLITWIPLLCQASNGTDTPTLSINERSEVRNAIEDIIDILGDTEDQERVLSVWLHHFTQSPSSDWPNLYNSYINWCTTSRNILVSR